MTTWGPTHLSNPWPLARPWPRDLSALARGPEVLFLDDCLSAVDTVTEEKILSNLDRELKETTLIWVAHRKSTLKYCDRIIDLDVPCQEKTILQ